MVKFRLRAKQHMGKQLSSRRGAAPLRDAQKL